MHSPKFVIRHFILSILLIALTTAPATAGNAALPAQATLTAAVQKKDQGKPAGKVVIKGKGGTVTDVKQDPPPQKPKDKKK